MTPVYVDSSFRLPPAWALEMVLVSFGAIFLQWLGVFSNIVTAWPWGPNGARARRMREIKEVNALRQQNNSGSRDVVINGVFYGKSIIPSVDDVLKEMKKEKIS